MTSKERQGARLYQMQDLPRVQQPWILVTQLPPPAPLAWQPTYWTEHRTEADEGVVIAASFRSPGPASPREAIAATSSAEKPFAIRASVDG